MSNAATEYHAALETARRALRARDAIDNCASPEWKAAHHTARRLFERADTLRADLVKSEGRYGSWRTPADRELVARGYL